MGNVLAASSPPAGPPPPPAPPLVGLPPPPPSPPGFTLPPLGGGLGAGAGTGRGSERTPGTAAASAGGTADDGACGCLPNPGTFEECHRKCKELFPIQMEGVKLTVNKGLSNHFQVNHTVALSTIGESNYHFGVTYVGTKQLSPTEAFPVLVGDMDNSGSLNAQVIHQLGPGLRSKMAIQTQQSKFVNWQVDGEYRGSDFTAAVTLGNPDVLVGSETPNTAGAGATGGIIGGIIAAIIATAVAATGILICRQQRKEQRLQGAEEEEELEGPPSYKPPTPKAKLEEPEMPSQLFTLGASEHSPLKTPYFDAGVSCAEQEMPRYHELPTLEERSGPLILGATSLGSPILVPPGPPAVERVSLDLEDEEEEEDYMDKINPIYDALSYSGPPESYQGKGFVMSRAMYV